MSIMSMQVLPSDRAASIAALEKSIERTKDQMEECKDAQFECRQRIAEINQKLIDIASIAEVRRKQLSALKQQKDLRNVEYLKAMAYAEMIGTSEDATLKTVAVKDLDIADKELKIADHAYIQARHDCDQLEAHELKDKNHLQHELAQLIDMISELEVNKRACLEGLEIGTLKLGVFLYEEAQACIEEYQADLVRKQEDLQTAQNDLQIALAEKVRKLENHPQLQLKLKSLVPFQDEVSILLDQAISLLTDYLAICELSVPTLGKLTGESLPRRVVEGNRLLLDSLLDQIRETDILRLYPFIDQLRMMLQHYIENGVR